VDVLVIDAARDLFARRGYAATTTREIASHAGVHEPMLFRRYGSKEGLFRAAVLVPFGEVITSYLELWESQVEEPLSLRELVTAFVDPLYALLREHSELAMAIVQARTLTVDAEREPGGTWPSELGRLLNQLNPQLEVEAARRSLRVDPSTTNVVVLGMVLGMALLDPVLPASGSGATPHKVSHAMVDLILHGVSPTAEPASPAQPEPVTTQVLLELHDRVVAAERRAAQAELALAQATRPGKGRTTSPR
jgi:AcrR family transcriptional regulator